MVTYDEMQQRNVNQAGTIRQYGERIHTLTEERDAARARVEDLMRGISNFRTELREIREHGALNRLQISKERDRANEEVAALREARDRQAATIRLYRGQIEQLKTELNHQPDSFEAATAESKIRVANKRDEFYCAALTGLLPHTLLGSATLKEVVDKADQVSRMSMRQRYPTPQDPGLNTGAAVAGLASAIGDM